MQNAFRNIVALHPPFNLLRLHLLPSNLKQKLAFIDLNKLSLLSFSDNCTHLGRFDVLVLLPLAHSRTVLSFPISRHRVNALSFIK